MLIRNVYTDQGLVNGAVGNIHSFEQDDNGVVEKVNVLFDDPSVGRVLNIDGHDFISVRRVEFSYILCGRNVVRSQFPLTLSWACTIHKVQGLSLTNVVVDLGLSVFERGMGYAALSRLRTLSGLYILEFSQKSIQPPCGVLEEYDRLRKL